MVTGGSTYNNYNPDKGRHSFEMASLVMSIIAMVLLCTGILSIPAGALGILFAILSRRENTPMSSMARTALILSAVSMIFGAMITVASIYTVMTDPTALDEVRELYARYGIEMPELPVIPAEGGS